MALEPNSFLMEFSREDIFRVKNKLQKQRQGSHIAGNTTDTEVLVNGGHSCCPAICGDSFSGCSDP